MVTRRIPIGAAMFGLAFGAGLGCAEDEQSGRDAVYDALTDEQVQIWEMRCECFAEFGYESEQECLDYVVAGLRPPESVHECASKVYGARADDDAALECMLQALRNYSACVEGLDCSEIYGGYYDGSELYACLLDYEELLEGCPGIPEDVEAEAESCFGD